MAGTTKAKSSRKFTRNHHFAILLVRHLGTNGAIQASYNNQWYGLLCAVKEQNPELRHRSEQREWSQWIEGAPCRIHDRSVTAHP